MDVKYMKKKYISLYFFINRIKDDQFI